MIYCLNITDFILVYLAYLRQILLHHPQKTPYIYQKRLYEPKNTIDTTVADD